MILSVSYIIASIVNVRAATLHLLSSFNLVVGDCTTADWHYGAVQLCPVIASVEAPEHSHLQIETDHCKQS